MESYFEVYRREHGDDAAEVILRQYRDRIESDGSFQHADCKSVSHVSDTECQQDTVPLNMNATVPTQNLMLILN
jgi:hypothetical protein